MKAERVCLFWWKSSLNCMCHTHMYCPTFFFKTLTQKKYKTLLFLQLPPFPDYFSFALIPRPKVVEVLFPRADACEGSHISLRIWSVFSQGTWCVFSPLGTWRKKRRTYYRAATCEQGFRITLWNGETTWWCTKMHFTFDFKKSRTPDLFSAYWIPLYSLTREAL